MSDSNDGWEAAPQGAVSLPTKMLMNDAALQANHPNWPTGGTSAQIGIESNYNPNAVGPETKAGTAKGMVQATDSTKAAVEQQIGRKLDFANVNDQLLFHRYLMNQNLDRTNGDPNAALSLYNSGRATPDNTETKNYVSKFDQRTADGKVDSPAADDSGWESAPTKAATPSTDGWETAPSKQPDAAAQRGNAAIAAMAPNTNAIGNAVTGIGETAAQMGSGMFGQAAGALHGAADLLTGSSYDQAHADLAKERDAVTYNPRTQAGQDISKNVGEMFDKYLTNPLEQGGQFVGEAAGLSPETAKQGAEIGTSLFENLGLPMLGGAFHGVARGAGDLRATPEVTGQLDALNAANAPAAAGPVGEPPLSPGMVRMYHGGLDLPGVTSRWVTPDRTYAEGYAGKSGDNGRVFYKDLPEDDPRLQKSFDDSGTSMKAPYMPFELRDMDAASMDVLNPNKDMSPNAGPQRGAFAVDSAGNVDTGVAPSMDQQYQAATLAKQRALDEENPNSGPQIPGDMRPNEGPQIEPDLLANRIEQMHAMMPEQLDIFGTDMDYEGGEGRVGDYSTKAEGNQVVNDLPRSLSSDEFTSVMQDLNEKDGTRFRTPDPADPAYGQYMDVSYSKYLDMVRDDQGGLFDRPSIAENFAKAASDEALSRRVNDHPTVKANQAKVDQLMAQDQSVPGVARATAAAQDVLQKSQDNISKFYQKTADAATPFYAKDGTVHMYTFGYLPEMMKSLGALLKGIHGVVFKTLDRMIPSFKNLDSFGKIAGQGIKDFVNSQANKEWAQKVNEQPRKVLNGVDALRAGLKDYLPDAPDLPPEQLKAQMQSVPDISGGKIREAMRNNTLTGQQLQAFTHHPLIKYAVNTVDSAMRSAQAFVRQQLTGKDGLRAKVQAMTPDEMTGIWAHMQMNEGVREFSAAELKHAGFSDKQIDFYQKRLELNKEKLNALNEGRAQAGLKPVDARIAHIAGHFLGDFKRVIRDGEGTVKAVIAHNSRAAVNIITKRVMEQLGEGHEAGPIEMRKLTEDNATDRYTGYMNVLNDMADHNQAVSAVVQAYKDYMSNDAQTAMRYRAAFKSKEGVIGAEGRKSWESAKTNAQEGIKNELKALESMNTWSEMQKALAKIKEFQTDPEINAPNAKGAVQAYLDNVQRRNQGMAASFANSVVNGVAEITGLGPTALRHMSATTKTGLLTMFIGLGKLSHSFVTLIQPLQGIPVVNSLMKAEGTRLGLTQVTAALKSMGSQAKLLAALGKGGDVADPFVRKAMEFAKDNDTLNTSQFQFGNLTDINRSRAMSNIHKAAEFNVTGMETATRAFTYMYYSHMLKDLGLPEKEIFPAAHNAMKDVMVDYNSWERPGVFGKLGFLGDLTAMLTRYKFNQIDQFARASKYAASGQLGPMTSIMATSIAAAGVRGIMAYTLANKLVQATTTWAAQNNLMDKPTSIDELLLHALHGKNENLSNALKFGLPSGLGLNMTGSLSHADDIPNDPLGALVPQSGPLGEMGKSIYDFARDPNKATGKTALYDMAPNSMKGVLENKMFTDANGKYSNPHNYELQHNRTPADQTKRTFGFRPLNEANDALTTHVNQDQRNAEGQVKQDIVQRVLRDVDSSNMKVTPQLQQDLQKKYIPKYVANEGDPRDIAKAIQDHVGMGQALTTAQRAQGIPRGNTLQAIFNYDRYGNLK